MRSEFQDVFKDAYDHWIDDACSHRYNASKSLALQVWNHQQSKVDELQKNNAWLSGVACRENKRANKLQEEKVSTTTLLGKTIQEKNELQNRVDELATAFNQLIEMESQSISTELDQFDKGWNQSARQTIENIFKLTGLGEQALKGGIK